MIQVRDSDGWNQSLDGKNEGNHIHSICILDVEARGLGDELTTENDGEGNNKAGNAHY